MVKSEKGTGKEKSASNNKNPVSGRNAERQSCTPRCYIFSSVWLLVRSS